MLARTLITTALITLTVVLNAYAPNRDRNGDQAAQDQRTIAANAKATTNTTIYHAPNQAIGMLRAGARVRVDKIDGNWAHIRYVNAQIAVQGWVDKRALARLTDGEGDGTKDLKDQKDRERDKERKQDRIREEKARKQLKDREQAKDR